MVFGSEGGANPSSVYDDSNYERGVIPEGEPEVNSGAQDVLQEPIIEIPRQEIESKEESKAG